jgi:hypothetical protein
MASYSLRYSRQSFDIFCFCGINGIDYDSVVLVTDPFLYDRDLRAGCVAIC